MKEIGATSAPLLSAYFFIGARCRPYNYDFMQCKTENPGKGEFECLKEGRRVTRCAASVYVQIPREGGTEALFFFGSKSEASEELAQYIGSDQKEPQRLTRIILMRL